jgi:GTP cyclohydrolase II
MLSTSSGETPQPRTGPLTTQATVRTRVEVPVRRSDRDWRTAEMVSFTGLADGREHFAVVVPFAQAVPLVRVHSECLTGDVFGSARCDCGPQLTEVVDLFSDRGGILLYLRQEGRGIGLYNKLEAYRLQDDRGLDTFAANRELNFSDDLRDYRVAAQMLRALGVTRIRLRTNNPDKIHQLENYGITVEEVLPTGVHRTERNHEYLRVKAEQGHTILLGESS